MPAYNYSVFFTIFFILYIVINTYTFMSFFLAVVYNNYKKYLKVFKSLSSQHATFSVTFILVTFILVTF